MTPEDWTALEELAKAFADKGMKATPSQVASAIIHRHVAQIRDGKEDVADLGDREPDLFLRGVDFHLLTPVRRFC